MNKSIQEKANDIRTKRYGSEVRESLASGLEVVGEVAGTADDRSKSTENRQTKVETGFKALQQGYTENGNGAQSSAEIITARDGEPVLADRLSRDFGNVNAQLTQTMSKEEFDSWVATILDGGPSIFFETLSALKTAYPQGSSGVALVRETDPARIYVWDGSEWKDFGAYQGVVIKDKSVTYEKQDFISISDNKDFTYTFQKDVSHLYKNEWVNYENDTRNAVTAPRSVVAPIMPYATVTIETKGEHDRFTVYTSKHATAKTSATEVKKIYVKNEDALSEGNETYTFQNESDTFVIIGISSTGIEFPAVTLTQKFADDLRPRLQTLEKENQMGYLPLTNDVVNGDFSKGTTGWGATDATFTVTNGAAKVTASAKGGTIRQTRFRTEGHLYYLSAELKSTSKDVSLNINGGDLPSTFSSGSGEFEKVSTLYTSPSTGYWQFGAKDDRSSGFSEFEATNFIVIDLTTIFGSGKEPSLDVLNNIINELPGRYFEGTVSNYVTIHQLVKKHEEQLSQKPEVQKTDTGIEKTKDVYPVMFGVKTTNEKDNEIPRPVGWLYYVPKAPYEILFAAGRPENMKHLCYWDKSKTWDGKKDPSWYRPHITKEGDIVFVYRGDRHGLGSSDPTSRQNPIIYPANDWGNPYVVEFGTKLKPTSWLQNSGVEHIYNQDFFMFAEYTRPHHLTCNTWKVTKPYSNPDNWRVVQSFPLSGDNQTGMKHLHQVDYDPFSKKIFTSTGDDNDAAKIFMSSDYGESWNVVLEGQRKYARVLNFVFTKDKVYWANDDSSHGFYSVDRGVDGVPDFTNITTLFDLTGHPPTYVNCYIDDPNGIMLLHRNDGESNGPLKVHFWDIETGTMHEIKDIYPNEGENIEWGFRVEAANVYQSRGKNETVVGFYDPRNKMKLLDNSIGLGIDRINNMVLKVIPSENGFDLDISANQL